MCCYKFILSFECYNSHFTDDVISMLLRCFLVFVVMIVCVASTAYALDGVVNKQARAAQMGEQFAETLSEWENLLDYTAKKLRNEEVMDADKLSLLQEQLKDLKNQSFTRSIAIQDELRSQNELLKALGDAPADPAGEDESVQKERARLTTKVALIDAQLKQTKLVVAKTEDALKALNDIETQKLRSKLMTRQFLPLTAMEINGLLSEIYSYIAQFNNWVGLGLMLTAILLLSFATVPFTAHINTMLDEAKNIKLLKKMTRKRMAIVTVASYFAALMRFNMINFEGYETLEYLVKMVSAISLACILFVALGKFRFIDSQSVNIKLGEDKRSYSWLWNGIRNVARAALALIPLMSVAGYVNLGLYLGLNILVTILALLAFTIFRQLAVMLNKKIAADAEHKDDKLSPLTITLVEPVLALLMIAFASFFWGLTSDDVTGWLEKYKNGIPVGDITIDFGSIGASIALFFTLYVVTKVLQWFLSSRVFPHTAMSSGIRDAIISLLGYVGVIVAFLASIGAIGLDLSNLAIVAGALSVGIGFGMQAIFNNFVSGLILLFERPVKVGDWIVVGQHQGIIKKIRVRSTEIETFQNSSIIVPNSLLISDTVTNWTLHDRVGRVDIAVGVAYGTDTDVVKKVLLATASQHPQVRSYPAAQVIFMNFGESSLDFELRCFIHNIRDIFGVASELRFDINNAFRANNIEIPYPQREIHIKQPTSPVTKTSSEDIDRMAYRNK
jgi:small-conductance mechanosensitive channel